MEELLAIANMRGLRVGWRDLGRRHGEFHSSGLILLNPKRTMFTQRITLAHELGHAAHGHAWTDDPSKHAHQERLADEHAAALLITPNDYRAAEALAGPHAGALARELGVTPQIVEAWRRHHTSRPRRTA